MRRTERRPGVVAGVVQCIMVTRRPAMVYATDDCKEKFVRGFVAARDKVMNQDRYDLA